MAITSVTGFRMWKEGRYEEYVELKSRLREEGVVAAAMKSRVDKAYPPLGEEDLEERRKLGLAPSAAEVEEAAERIGVVSACRSRVEREKLGEEGSPRGEKGGQGVVRKGVSVSGRKGASEQSGALPMAGQSGAPPMPELFPASRFRQTAGISPVEEVEWVKNHLAVEDVEPEQAPSAGAYAMWQTYTRNRTARQFFFEKVLPRAMPSIRDEKQRQRFKDDGRKLDDLRDGVGKLAEAAVEDAREQWRRRGAAFVLEDVV